MKENGQDLGQSGAYRVALQQIFGHSTIVVTQRYARLSDDLVRGRSAFTVARP